MCWAFKIRCFQIIAWVFVWFMIKCKEGMFMDYCIGLDMGSYSRGHSGVCTLCILCIYRGLTEIKITYLVIQDLAIVQV